jgi:hypothetical protein
MACKELGLHPKGEGRATLRVSKIDDRNESLTLPSGYDVTDWTSVLAVRAEQDSSALLTVTTTATAEGSVVTLDGRVMGFLLKADDLATLPDDADDAATPWVGWWDWTVTDPEGGQSRLLCGACIVEKR